MKTKEKEEINQLSTTELYSKSGARHFEWYKEST